MGLLDFFAVGAQASAQLGRRDPFDDRWYSGRRAQSSIGVGVTVKRARRVPVVRDCLGILSEAVASLDFGVVERRGGGLVREIPEHPAAQLLRDPNPRDTGFDFIATMIDDLCTEGDFYAEIQQDTLALRRLEPTRTEPVELPDGSVRYDHRTKNGEFRRFTEGQGRIWHIRRPPLKDEIRGTSPILDDGLEAVAVAIALQEYANALFTNDATPNFALTLPAGATMEGESRENFLRAWVRHVTGRNRHRPAVLENGIEPKRLGLTAEEAQFLETRRELWLDLTRLWHVPPHKVGILDKATFSNIEHQALEFVTDTLRPMLELVERSVNKFLIRDPRFRFEFNVASLLRGDLKARYEAYAKGRQWGWLSVNDILRMEGRNPIGPAGDRYIEPLNMSPVGSAAPDPQQEQRAATARAIEFLRESTDATGGRPRLEIVKDAA
ncbi:MAG: phage portal protein [Pseudomonadota bacterium]